MTESPVFAGLFCFKTFELVPEVFRHKALGVASGSSPVMFGFLFLRHVRA